MYSVCVDFSKMAGSAITILIFTVLAVLALKFCYKVAKFIIMGIIVLAMTVLVLCVDYPRWLLNPSEHPRHLAYFNVEIYDSVTESSEICWMYNGHNIGEGKLYDFMPEAVDEWQLVAYLTAHDKELYLDEYAAVGPNATVQDFIEQRLKEIKLDLYYTFIRPWEVDTRELSHT